MKNRTMYHVGALLATGIAGVATGQFEGPYDPANWVFWSIVGGSFTNDGTTLVLTGGDIGIVGNTDYTIMAAATGNWSFTWNYSSPDDGTWDSGGYILNEYYYLLGIQDGDGGKETIRVTFGDTIGYRAYTASGVFGPGILTISRFDAPVPGPAAAALLGVAGLLSRRLRRRRT